MIYELNYSDKGFSVEAAIAKGRALPDWALNEPQIDPLEYFYIGAFHDLSTCRQIANGMPMPIPWTAIREYAVFSQLDDITANLFMLIINRLDGAYMKWMNEKLEKTRGKPKSV